MKNTAISINVFRSGGGMESYTFDLVKQMTAQGRAVKVYAAKFDDTLPIYRHIEPVLINQKKIPKKLRPFFFARQLDSIRRNRSNYATAKSIMAHSEMMRRELVELYQVPSEKIRTVYPPADTGCFFPHPDGIAATRRQYGWRDDETVFLFPSTGHKRKGLDLLAEFFERTELPVRLAVAGSPLPRPMKNVQELGFCNNMPDLYRAADYTVMASLYEPFGLVGIESVLCGTRVVLADNMACCEVMKPEAGFFFNRANPQTLADAVARAVALKAGGAHRIASPLQALNYNPTLAHHLAQLDKMLQAV